MPLSSLASRPRAAASLRETALRHSRAALLLLPALPLSAQTSINLTAPWTPLGPSSLVSASYGSVTGRITATALDPNDPTGNTLYLGTTGGGVWKSTTAAGPLAAITFAPLTDNLPVFSANAGSGILPSITIGALAVQPAPHPILLAGTGDANDASDSFYGEGLLRSTDSGATWTLVQTSHDGVNGNHSFIGMATAGLAFSAANPSLVVAAFSTSGEGTIVNALSVASIPGLYYSTDAGLTWQMASLYDGTQVVQTPQPYAPNQPGNPVTAVVYDAQRALFLAAVRYHGYYASPDGITWKRLTAQPGTALSLTACPSNPESTGSIRCPIFRGALAVQPATGDLYALTVDSNNLDQGLWQDLCHLTGSACTTPQPTFSTRLDNAAFEVGSGSTAIAQGTYNLTLAAAPTTANGTLLFAGTIDLYRCALNANASACSWRNTTNAVNGCAAPAHVAPAQHALAAIAQTSGSPLLFLGNDSGLWRSLDGVNETGSPCAATDATHFDNLNPAIAVGGSLAEITGFAQHPSNPDTLLAGTGANGSGATTTASALTAWPQLSAGEGGFPLLDPNNPTNWLLAIGAEVNLKLCTLGALCTATNFTPPATVGESLVANDVAQLDAPTLLDPATSTNLLLATCRVWRGPVSGSTWTAANALSAPFDRRSVPCNPSSALVRSLAAGGPAATSASAQWSGATILYAGLSGALDGGQGIAGHVFLTKAANTASSTTQWTDLGLSPVTNDPSGFNPGAFDVSSLAVDPHDPTGATVYATILGFGQPHLYRSTDFGAHWTNVSANLPNAPASAVLIDPNDANTLYIALDTGVYVTSAVTACASANCWSPLGTALPNSPVTSLATAPSLPVGDGRLGLLRAGTYGRGLWSTPLVTAAVPLAPALTASPASLTFTPQPLNTPSPAQTVTLTSTGNTSVTIGDLTLTGPFRIATDNCSEHTLAAGTACTVGLVFTPAALGPASGQLTVPANIAAGSLALPLSGTGISPATDTLAPTSLTFSAQPLNTSSPSQTLTLTNSGDAPLTITSLTTSNPAFGQTSTCTASVAAHSTCTIAITFTPTTSGPITAALTLTDSLGTNTLALTGSGYLPATDTLTPLTFAFATQQVALASAPQTAALTNTGDVPLAITSILSSTSDFAVTSNCGIALAAHTSCTLSIVFTPTTIGPRPGSILVTDSLRPQAITLNGTGAAPPGVSLTPATLAFSPTLATTTAPAQTLTLTNNGSLPLLLASTTLSPSFTLASTTCAASLAPAAACTLSITFTPPAIGPYTGTLTLTDNAPGSPQTITLTGSGTTAATASLSATSLNFAGTPVSSTSPVQTLTLTNTGGLPLTVTSTAIQGAFVLLANTCGAALAAGASCSLSIAFAPAAAGAATGTLTLTTSASPATQAIPLTGNGQAPATDTLTPLALTFAAQATTTTSPAQAITLTNTGDLPLTLATLTSSSTEFSLAANTCGTSLPAHTACTLAITFTPTASGTRSAVLTLVDNLRTTTLPLTGTGVAPATLVLLPAALTFPATLLNQTSAAQIITVSNTGGASATLQTPTLTGDFTLANNTCGAILAPQTGCSIAITFTPTASGARTGTLTIPTSVGTQTAPLTGTGNAQATDALSTLAINFPLQQVGTTSAPQQVTLTNTGDAALTLIAASTSSNEFGATNYCGTSLAAHATCAIAVTFTPTATGTRTGTLTLSDVFRTQIVTLNGTAAAPAGVSLTPTSLNFGAIAVGSISTTQALTLTNNGGLPLTITSAVVSGPFTVAATTCTATLAAGAACAYQIAYAPLTAGAAAGNFTLLSNATNGTQSVPINATGIDFTLAATSPTALTVSSGQAATYTLQLSSAATLTGAVALTCTGAPAHTACVISPSTGALGSTQNLTVVLTTGIAARAPGPQLPWLRSSPILFALGLPCLLFARRRLSALLPLALLAALLTTTGCGAGRTIPPGAVPVGTPTPTANGTYNLTITAASSGITHTVALTLTVQ